MKGCYEALDPEVRRYINTFTLNIRCTNNAVWQAFTCQARHLEFETGGDF